MAVYHTQTSYGINEVRAVTQGPEAGPALVVRNEFAPSASGFVAYAAVLDGRYKKGGSTTWERPPASGL